MVLQIIITLVAWELVKFGVYMYFQWRKKRKPLN